jgi:hypothetical protein
MEKVDATIIPRNHRKVEGAEEGPPTFASVFSAAMVEEAKLWGEAFGASSVFTLPPPCFGKFRLKDVTPAEI